MRRRGKEALLAWCAALALVLTACGGEPPAAESPAASSTVRPTPTAEVQRAPFALPCYPEAGFHPITGTNRVNLELTGLVYDGLYRVDQSFVARNALAASQSVSADGLVWTITLRQGVTFSDGSALTPQDVVYSLNLARESERYGYRLSQISGVSAGEGTVMVTLSLPNGALDALLDVPILKESGGGVPLGTGPYVLQSAGGEYSLARRAESWRFDAGLPETILLRSITGSDALVSAFDTGDLTLVNTDLTGSSPLGFSGNYETCDYPTSNLVYVGFNTASGVCSDALVRRALAAGMDRSTLARVILAHHAQAAPLPVHPQSVLYPETLAEELSYSPQNLENLLMEAGWSRGDGQYFTRRGRELEVTLLVNQDNSYKCDLAAELARELESAGVHVTVDQRTWSDYLAALEAGEFDLYLAETRLTADFTLTPLLTGGSLNYGQYNDWTTSTLHADFRAARGEVRQNAAAALYEALAEQMPFTALCFKNGSVLTQWGQITGLTPTQGDLFYQVENWEIAAGKES